jgi:transposase
MTEKAKKWSEDTVAQLMKLVGKQRPVSADTVMQAAESLGEDFTPRSVASKLRQLEVEVASMAKEKTSAFTEDESAELAEFVVNNAGSLTYKQIAEEFMDGKFTAKQIQGKLLALELTGSVKPAEKVEIARTYTDAEESKFIALAEKGAFIEDIAAALNKSISSVRGKALSLTRKGQIGKIPAQKNSYAKEQVDPVAQLGAKIHTMTVAEIAAAIDKTERGLKTLLTRRGIKVADYDGAAKRAKAEARQAA